MRKSKRTVAQATVDEILGEHLKSIQRAFSRLRQLLRELVPELEERPYPGWHGIGFRHPDAGSICGVFPCNDLVRLVDPTKF